MQLNRVLVKPFNKDRFEVATDYEFSIDIPVKNLSITRDIVKGIIPRGYLTDGASIPRVFWCFYPPYRSEYFSACVIHDFLCSRAMHAESIKEAYKKADRVLYEAMLSLGVSKMTSFIFWQWCDKFHFFKCLFKGWK